MLWTIFFNFILQFAITILFNLLAMNELEEVIYFLKIECTFL